MTTPPGKISWVVPPAETCVLCHKPILGGQEPSTWNGQPAHGDCVRVHMMQRNPVFRDWTEESSGEGGGGGEEEGITRSDDDEDEGF